MPYPVARERRCGSCHDDSRARHRRAATSAATAAATSAATAAATPASRNIFREAVSRASSVRAASNVDETVPLGSSAFVAISSIDVSVSRIDSYTRRSSSLSSGKARTAASGAGLLSGNRICRSSRISLASMTSFAPCWMRRFEPIARRRVDVAGHGVNVPALLERLRNADERAAVRAGFDHEQALAPTADDAVAHRERLAIRFDLHREFGNDGAVAAPDFFSERGVLRRIQLRQSGADHRHRATLWLQARPGAPRCRCRAPAR